MLKLIQKLTAYGIRAYGSGLRILTGRKQRVLIGDNSSEWEDVTSSVPHGSDLRPLLFTILFTG